MPQTEKHGIWLIKVRSCVSIINVRTRGKIMCLSPCLLNCNLLHLLLPSFLNGIPILTFIARLMLQCLVAILWSCGTTRANRKFNNHQMDKLMGDHSFWLIWHKYQKAYRIVISVSLSSSGVIIWHRLWTFVLTTGLTMKTWYFAHVSTYAPSVNT